MPVTRSMFVMIQRNLWEMTYSRIISIIEEEKEKVEDVTTRAKPVVELRDRIKPQIVELVKKQRLMHLTEGSIFHTFSNKGRQQRHNWCCRLSPNHRVLHWNTPDENCTHVMSLEELPKKGMDGITRVYCSSTWVLFHCCPK